MRSVNKKFIKTLAIIFAALFLLTVFIAAFGGVLGGLFSAGALESEEQAVIAESNEAEDMISSASSISEKTVRVGMMFKSSLYDFIKPSHSISSDTGFRFFMRNKDGGESYSYVCYSRSVTLLREGDLSRGPDGSFVPSDPENSALHTYALRMSDSFPTGVSLKQEMKYVSDLLSAKDVYPLFFNGQMYVGIGDYDTEKTALKRYDIASTLYKRTMALKSPKPSYITVVDDATGNVVLRADTENYPLYVEPYVGSGAKTGDDDTYVLSLSIEASKIEITEPAAVFTERPCLKDNSSGNIYAGTFEYAASEEGLTLINELKLDDYVKSVVPYEIYVSWPEEAIKAFAVAARTYALTTVHTDGNFDMCSESHCQAYRGRTKSTAYSDSCVDAVKDVILTYDGKPAKTFYHAVSGGATESAANAWGSDPAAYPYLVGQSVPEEKYGEHRNGVWESGAPMNEISEYVLENNPSFASKLNGPITDISVESVTPTGYVYEVLLSDAEGNSVSVKKTDTVRRLFSKYVKSARFTLSWGTPAIRGTGTDTLSPGTLYKVLTASGEIMVDPSEKLFAITSSGVVGIGSGDSVKFSGTGWGHGVGMSQYGAYDMALAGYTYGMILSKYYPGTKLERKAG